MKRYKDAKSAGKTMPLKHRSRWRATPTVRRWSLHCGS